MTNQVYFTEIHADHKIWLSEILLSKDELNTFQHRLEEIAKANTSAEVRASIEQFQNRFIREKEVIDTLLHDIRIEETLLFTEVTANNVATDRRKIADNLGLRNNMESYRKMFAELKQDFIRFLAKTL